MYVDEHAMNKTIVKVKNISDDETITVTTQFMEARIKRWACGLMRASNFYSLITLTLIDLDFGCTEMSLNDWGIKVKSTPLWKMIPWTLH